MDTGVILGLVGGGAFGFSLLGSRERKKLSEEEALPFIASFKETSPTARSWPSWAPT